MYGSCVVYVVLWAACVLADWCIASIVILCIAAFEQIAMSMMPVPKASAAFQLVRIDAANYVMTVDKNGFMFTTGTSL